MFFWRLIVQIMILKKNFLKNLLPRRDMSCSQNGNVGKFQIFWTMSYLVIRRLKIKRKIYWLSKITYIECLINKYTTHILWSELWIVYERTKICFKISYFEWCSSWQTFLCNLLSHFEHFSLVLLLQ